MPRQLIIGDIHGCFYELQALLDKAALNEDDEIISVGDMVDRGPESLEVVKFFMAHPHARAVRGNHEQKHLRAIKGEAQPALSQLIARWEIGSEYEVVLAYFRSLPFYLELDDALIVHAYLEPDIPLEEQEASILMGTLSAEKHLKKNYDDAWYTYYKGKKPVIVGHKRYMEDFENLNYDGRVWGLDTACVHGEALTGLLLPDFKLISVPARRDHWGKVTRRFLEDDGVK